MHSTLLCECRLVWGRVRSRELYAREHTVVFTHWSSNNFFTVCVSEAVAHVELVEFGLKSNLKFYNFGQVESYV